jgi:tetratricopeptide (TPR) repeat protein
VYYNKGCTLLEMRRYKDALITLNQAISLNPDYASAHYNRGRVLLGMQRFEEALQAFERTIQLDPTHAAARKDQTFVLSLLPKKYKTRNAVPKSPTLWQTISKHLSRKP